MRMCAALVKPLARFTALWHLPGMKKPEDKSREERLAEALRANLRRRKMQNRQDSPIGEDDEPRPK
jgi:hypothetical protein